MGEGSREAVAGFGVIVAVVEGSDYLDTTDPTAPGTVYAERKARAYLANFLHCIRRTPGSVLIVEEPRRGPELWALEFARGMGLDALVYMNDGSIIGRRKGAEVCQSWGSPAEDAGGRIDEIARVCRAAGRRGDIVMVGVYLSQYPDDEAAALLPRAVWKRTPKFNLQAYRWTFKSSGAVVGGLVREPVKPQHDVPLFPR